MAQHSQLPLDNLDEDAALRAILEGTATETGERFFAALVENVAKALHTYGAWVTEYLPEARRLRALAFWLDGQFVDDWEMDIEGTPCQAVIDGARLVHFPDNVLGLYPLDPDLAAAGAASYMGVPLLDLDGTVMGHLAVLDTRPMPEEPRAHAIIRIFAARAAAEVRRMRAEAQIREREEKLGRLVSSAMDGIIEFDQDLNVTRMNPAAEKSFHCAESDMAGRGLLNFFSEENRATIAALIEKLNALPEGEQSLWIPGQLIAFRLDGSAFPAEATLSRYEMGGQQFHTLILRDVKERIHAEQMIRSLTVETEYLREEIKELHHHGSIVGKSKALRQVLDDIQQVAGSDTTVLILGETGTGKELVARAIHDAGMRHDKPLIKVNCAAIPVSLMESEFFGHEKGAFTGATAKREGRFALADGGTIFLDEVGDLPVDLQAKLLRVLQEGEFEPVGSAETRKVDVRVIAATNRDLQRAVDKGEFREDLYYRLNVFPLHVPALRDRGDDVAILAAEFANRFAQRMGRTLEPLTENCVRRLKAYTWPGNVRELENVIERAVITAQGGRLNLDRALPDASAPPLSEAAPTTSETGSTPVLTVQELQAIERKNIVRALESTRWRVSGDNGAARLLGMNPSTLSSRMKALGIKRPK